MSNEQNHEIRDIKDGDWCWIHKAVIQRYVPIIGATGIAVYCFLASLADRNQNCFPSQGCIAKALGYSRATISKAVKLLEKHGLIRIERRTRYHCVYHLLKVRCKADETQMLNRGNSDVKQVNTNNNKITINNNNNDIVDKNIFNSKRAFKGFAPQSREELLALDLAQGLNDYRNLPLYLSYAWKYPESVLRRALGGVKEVPEKKIKKGRGALFNYLVKKYAQETNNNPGDQSWDKVFRSSALSRDRA